MKESTLLLLGTVGLLATFSWSSMPLRRRVLFSAQVAGLAAGSLMLYVGFNPHIINYF